MELSQGAVEAIQKTAREAEINKAHVQLLKGPDPRKMILVQGTTHEEIDVPPEHRCHQVFSLTDLVEAVKRQDAPVVWHSAEKVVCILDDADRRDRIEFELQASDAWRQLAVLDEQGRAFTQKEFIRLLKTYLGASPATVAVFRALDFQTQIRGAGEVQKGRESLGNSVLSEVKSSGAELPDDLTVSVPIYSTPGEREPVTVRLLLDYDVTQNPPRIFVQPEPDLLADLLDRHQQDIRERLEEGLGTKDETADKEVPIYYGVP